MADIPIVSVVNTPSDEIATKTFVAATYVALGGKLKLAYVEKIAGYTLTATDYTVNFTANNCTALLPTAIGITGTIYEIKNSGNGTVIVDANASELIDDVLTISLSKGENLTVQSTGTKWIIL